MPLLFLLVYIAILHFIHKKNIDKVQQIPFIIRITWIIPFLLLFVFMVYYSEVNLSNREEIWYVYSFYFLAISYFVSYIVYCMKFKAVLKQNNYKQVISNNIWKIENRMNKLYFIVILFLSSLYFFFSKPFNIVNWDWIQILLYMFFISFSIYSLSEKKILSISK